MILISSYDTPLQERQILLSQVTAVATTVGTGAVTVASLCASGLSQQQTCILTNTDSAKTLYVGFLSTMSASSGYSFKLSAAGGYQSLQINRNMLDSVYLVGSAAGSQVTIVLGN